VTDESAGFSLKVKTLPGFADLLGEADGLGGVGEAVEACSPPQAATQSRIEASASQHRVLDIYRSRLLERAGDSARPACDLLKVQTWCAAGAGRRRVRQNR